MKYINVPLSSLELLFSQSLIKLNNTGNVLFVYMVNAYLLLLLNVYSNFVYLAFEHSKETSAPIGALDLPAFLGTYDRPTNRPTEGH